MGGQLKSRALTNITHWAMAAIGSLRQLLHDEGPADGGNELRMLRGLPHDHIAAALGTGRKTDLAQLVASVHAPARMVAELPTMVVARVVDPVSKLATARQLDAATASSSLGALLGLVSF